MCRNIGLIYQAAWEVLGFLTALSARFILTLGSAATLLHKTHLSHLSQCLGDKKTHGKMRKQKTALPQVTTLLYPECSMVLKVPLLVQGLIKSIPIGPSVAPGPFCTCFFPG